MNEETERDVESILQKFAKTQVVLAQEIAALVGAGPKMLDLVAILEHRVVVLESRMENVLARLDGHDLGFAALHLGDESREDLARMTRLGEKGRPIVPGEEGTSES